MVDVAKVEQFLIDVINNNQVTTYGDVANLFGLEPFNGDWGGHALCYIFDEIDRRDAINNRPFKTAVVLKRSNGHVGNGFFSALKRYKNISCVNKVAKEAAWINEINGCYAYTW
jgi:hypothetical protein